MRLITRSDFDGLACAALLKEAGIIDHWKFAHPKDLQDGLVEVTENDCLALLHPAPVLFTNTTAEEKNSHNLTI